MTRSPTRKRRFVGIASIELESRPSPGFKTNGIAFSRYRSNSCDVRAVIAIPALQHLSLRTDRDLRKVFSFGEVPAFICVAEPAAMLDFSGQGTGSKEVLLFDLVRKSINASPEVTVEDHGVVARTRRRGVHWHPYAPKVSTVFVNENQKFISTTRRPSVLDSSPLDSPSPSPLGITRRNLTKEGTTSARRETTKPLMANGLVVLAIKSLKDIWQLGRTPPPSYLEFTQIFLLKSSTSSPPSTPAQHLPPLSTPYSSLASPPLRAAQHFADVHGSSQPVEAYCDRLPLHLYVYDIVRRSRTTRSVLQSAICYVKAVRPQIPALIERGRLGNALERVPKIEDRIEVGTGTPSKIRHTSEPMSTEASHPQTFVPRASAQPLPPSSATPQDDEQNAAASQDVKIRQKRLNSPSKPLPPLPDMPSPLLCPRRSFLAALILATKFLQDRCCSNRQWAKLSGLEPREVGRCERALGEALGWRLWVGKPPSTLPSLPREGAA